jgi:ABC-type uncharacterized transport system permease subunit
MEAGTTISATAVVAMAPAAIAAWRGWERGLFWPLLGVALTGPLVWITRTLGPGWHTGLSAALWVTIAVTLVVYAVVAAAKREARGLAGLLLPYLMLLGIAATAFLHQPERPLPPGAMSGWTDVHVVASVLAYALLTIGAVAGFSVFLQERTLKRKRPSRMSHILPPVADGERLQTSLLAASAAVLAFGLVSGAGAQYVLDGRWIALDHKTVLSIATFIVLVAILIAQRTSGIRGRRAARAVLLAYLLLTLAFPGVKFVTDVILV